MVVTNLKLLMSPGAQSTMKAFGFQVGIVDVSWSLRDRIQGARLASTVFNVSTKAIGMPLCQSSKTITCKEGIVQHQQSQSKYTSCVW